MSDGYVITKSSEDNYDGFARAMGDDPAANKNYSCDFYDRDYMTALQDQLVSRVMDYPVRAALIPILQRHAASDREAALFHFKRCLSDQLGAIYFKQRSL